MKAIKLLFVTIFLGMLCLTTEAQQQPDSLNRYHVETKDGNQYIGVLMSENADEISLLTDELGTIYIKKTDILKLSKLVSTEVVKGKIWLENTQSSRYFWAPNGFNLRKGEGYYQNLWVLMNQISFGISNNFSLGAGIIPLFLFTTEAAQYSPVWLVPKFSIPIKEDEFNIGVGALLGNVGLERKSGFGIAYGVGTMGNRNNNVSLGLGYGYAGGSWAKTPVVMMGLMIRTGPKGYVLSENYFIKNEDLMLILSIGGRSMSSHIGIDYGLFVPIGPNGSFAFPWLGLCVPFKNSKK